MNRKHFLSIIICAYNAERTISGTLECIFKEKDVEKEVIFIDDGSIDRTVEICRAYPVRILQLDRNLGPAYCRNAGAKLAIGDILFWIDADVRFEAGLLSAILLKMDESPEMAGVGTISSSVPVNKSFFSRYYALQQYQREMRLFGKRQTIVRKFICTRCGSLKKHVFEEIGGFDECFNKPSWEDYEFSIRLKGKYGVLYDRELTNKHFFPDSFSKIFRRHFINSRVFGQLLSSGRIKKIFPYIRSDTRAYAAIFLSLLFFMLTPFSRSFLFVSVILHIFALFEKRALLRMLYKSENVFFMLKSWIIYCIFSISIAFGIACGFLQQIHLFSWRVNKK